MNDSFDVEARRVGQVEIYANEYLLLEGEQISDRRFDGVELGKFTAVDCRFSNCTFAKAVIKNACWGGGATRTDYIDCKFDGASFSSTSPGNARFVNCSFQNVRISEFYARDIELIDCRFSGVIKKGFIYGRRDRAKLGPHERHHNQIEGNDFHECEFGDFSFRSGVRLDPAKLPSGPRFAFIEDLRSSLEGARAYVAAWSSPEDRKLGNAIISSLEFDLEDGQQQQLYVVTESGKWAPVSKRLAAFFGEA